MINMLNLLIADDNIDFARNLMHFINSSSNNVRVFDIAINGQETLEILNKPNNIDIILLDLNMPFFNGIDIINQLSFKPMNKYINSFIVISGEVQLVEQVQLLKSQLVYKVLPKCLDLKLIVSNINELITQKVANKNIQEVRTQISKELTSIGYLQSHNGTQYLIDIIEMLYLRGEHCDKSLSKYIYPIIAKRYNQPNINVKSSIARATEFMYYNCPESKLLDYFSLTSVSKPNIKTIINTVLLKLPKT